MKHKIGILGFPAGLLQSEFIFLLSQITATSRAGIKSIQTLLLPIILKNGNYTVWYQVSFLLRGTLEKGSPCRKQVKSYQSGLRGQYSCCCWTITWQESKSFRIRGRNSRQDDFANWRVFIQGYLTCTTPNVLIWLIPTISGVVPVGLLSLSWIFQNNFTRCPYKSSFIIFFNHTFIRAHPSWPLVCIAFLHVLYLKHWIQLPKHLLTLGNMHHVCSAKGRPASMSWKCKMVLGT